MAGRAFVLNLDADVELAAIASGAPAYTPSARVLEVMRPHAARLAEVLLGPDDVLVDETTPPGAMHGRPGDAFCPTPRALGLLARAGAAVPDAPSADVLARVNGRSFAHEVGSGLPAAAFVTTLEAAHAKLATHLPDGVATRWRIKRAFGMAGRGQRTVTPGEIAGADLALLRGGMTEGGVTIEPDVRVERELAMHGRLARDGAVELGSLVAQRCDARGQWLATARLDSLDPAHAHEAEIRRVAERVANALAAASYHGPFGIDAFLWRDLGGSEHLQPLSEINARLSMGWALGMTVRSS